MQKSFGRPREDGKHTAYTHHQPCQLHGFVYVSRNSQLVSNFPLRSAMQAVSAHCRPTLHHQHLMCLYLEKNIVSIPAPRATPTMYKSVKMRGTPKQFMYVNWDPTIIVGSHLHNTSIQLHNVYFIFSSSQGVAFRPLFFEYKLLVPYTHPFLDPLHQLIIGINVNLVHWYC